jgi:predicted NAD/FAD-binding protein
MDEIIQPAQKIAIVGSGISGLVAAHLLNEDHDITVFEANDYIGGHTHTVEVEEEGRVVSVDTGFIVFNEHNYPNFVQLLQNLNVEWQPAPMGFSVKCDRSGLEYNGSSVGQVFAQRRNLLRPWFLRMVRDILRFFREAPELLQGEDKSTTLGEYLQRNKYSQEFIDYHIFPMGAAIWSTAPQDMFDFPAQFFVRFFANHRFLQVRDRVAWRVVKGGSHQYVKALIKPFDNRIRRNCAVQKVQRDVGGVTLISAAGTERFDAVVLALHSDQALRLLGDASKTERQILGAIPYQKNETVLHTDTGVLPQRRRAWAGWNYYIPPGADGAVAVTYNMNMLQSLKTRQTYCVTLNRPQDVASEHIIKSMTYHHPRFTPASIVAQQRRAEINGVNRTYYCGAYWGYGFHEDGVRSGLEVAALFGKRLEPCTVASTRVESAIVV